MECKLLSNGLAISYNQVVKPCCLFQTSDEWKKIHHVSKVDLSTWHQSDQIRNLEETLAQGRWPKECTMCQQVEAQGRGDSIRLNAASSFGSYASDDITLEIRPGSTCNFACQTCWPEASSKVRQYYQKAKLLTAIPIETTNRSYDFLLPIKQRIKNITVLGGEPFYDKNCKNFLSWIKENKFASELTMFTNGSTVDHDFINNYPGRINLTVSLDAVGRPAEYIRHGTVWDEVRENYLALLSNTKLEVSVNITTSPYNYWYLKDLIIFLSEHQPKNISFGLANVGGSLRFLDESVIPLENRIKLKASLVETAMVITKSSLPAEHKTNAISTVKSIIANLNAKSFDAGSHRQFVEFVGKMDQAKGIAVEDYCPEVSKCL